MAWKTINSEWCPGVRVYRVDVICDTEIDVADLPESPTGSTALVVETGTVYMVNASGNWVKFGG